MRHDAGPPADGMPPAPGLASAPGPSGELSRTIDVNNEDAAECAEFERVLSDIASRLSNVADGKFDEVVTVCLRMLVEFWQFDRGTLMAFSEHGCRFQVTHSWAVEGLPVAPSDVLLTPQIPWFTHQIRSGHIVSVSSSIDLPAAAGQERDYLLQHGLKSILALPLLMETTIVGALSLASLRSQRRWSLGLVCRLRLAGEILALGIRRHQYAQGLRAVAQAVGQVSLDHAATRTTVGKHSRDRAMRLMQAEHQERRRMGQVLHEDVMQLLSAVSMFVQAGKDAMPQSPARDKALASLKEAVQKLQELTLELRPEAVFNMTLAHGIRWLAHHMHRRYDLDVVIRIAATTGPVGDDVRDFLYDTARKLLENVAVHASCNLATLEIRRPDPNHIRLTVTDDGVGFNPASLEDLPCDGFGLFSIRERLELFGGMLEVKSSPGRGTRAVVTVLLSD